MMTDALDIHQTGVILANKLPDMLGASHLLVYNLCKRDMWKEARMVLCAIYGGFIFGNMFFRLLVK
jgi:hypothetical protein